MKKFILFLSITITLIITGCDNDGINNSSILNSVDIYVAGSINGTACFWKNNQQTTLDNDGFGNSYATEIFVINNNIYIWGIGYDNSQQANLLWTNGIATNLNIAFSEPDFEVSLISDFYVYNEDVYFIGYLRSVSNPSHLDLVYWKNGNKTIIQENTIYDGNSPSIIVTNDDVYVYLKNTNNEYVIYINNAFYSINQNYGGVRLAAEENDVYIYGQILASSNGFYYNINTGIEINTPYYVNRLVIDKNDIYTLALYSGGSFLEKILKNNNLYYQTPEEFIVDDFVIHGGILYSIERKMANNGPQIVLANNEPVQILENPTSLSDSFLRDIYVVEH